MNFLFLYVMSLMDGNISFNDLMDTLFDFVFCLQVFIKKKYFLFIYLFEGKIELFFLIIVVLYSFLVPATMENKQNGLG